MKKIHITLVGGQPAPVYHGIVALQPDKIVYIYSIDSRKQLDVLLHEIDIEHEAIQLDPTNPILIKQCAEKLATQYAHDEVSVNISGGLKSWSHWFGIIFNNCANASVIYIDQNNVLWNYRTMQSTSDFEFDMHTHFRLYGNELKKYTPFSKYTKADFKNINKIERLRQTNIDEFNSLTTIHEKKEQKLVRNTIVGHINTSNSYIEWNKKNHNVNISICDKSNTYRKDVTLSSPHIIDMIFYAGWFEAKIAKILSHWDKTREIYLNCRFPYRNGLDKNEVDIIINTGSKILFVECKTQITKPSDIDKFRSVIKVYGGMGSKGLFITDAPMKELDKAKCEEHGILTFSLSDAPIMGLTLEQTLYMLLDCELYNINTK